MSDVANSPDAIRASIFFLVIAALVVAEILLPRRPARRKPRWPANLALGALNAALPALIVRLLPAAALLAVASFAQQNNFGVIQSLPIHPFLAVALAVLLLDAAIYSQHLLMHHVPILWRLHKVHHCDRLLDVTTALRFHPLEILFSLAFKIVVILIIGPPVFAVFLFEIILNAMAMFNHANIKIPKPIDAALRLGVVTPDMHRVHHSPVPSETNANFGFNLSCWDRIFRTYQPRASSTRIGLDNEPSARRFIPALILPFQSSQQRKSS